MKEIIKHILFSGFVTTVITLCIFGIFYISHLAKNGIPYPELSIPAASILIVSIFLGIFWTLIAPEDTTGPR